jgi:uncharacterized alpha-E superfamily protein
LSSLLARFAEDIFWMARYLERAESLARLLDINETYARETTAGPDWQRILDLYADREIFLKDHKRMNAASILQYYVLDKKNPTSMSFAIAAARQNARAVRHLISTEMWTELNIFHNRIDGLTLRDIRESNIARMCGEIKHECQTIEGIAEGTLLRGEAWTFYLLGKYVERADQTTRVLDMGYERYSPGDDDALISVQWNTLLRSLAGYHAYRSRHPAGSYARDVAAFLLYDLEFTRAVALCVDRISAMLTDLQQRHGGKRHARVDAALKSLESTLGKELRGPIKQKQFHDFLDDLQVKIGHMSEQIGAAYFGLT